MSDTIDKTIQENAAGQTGTITGDGYMYINCHGTTGGAEAIVQGFGDIHMTGYIENNGVVIADGWGGENTSDRTLSMVNFSEVITTESKQLDGAGWYAQNRGKLVLPDIAVAAGASTAFFGEDAAGAQKLVNSMKLDFAGVNGGDLTISLLAADHSEAADIDGDVLGVWSIDGDAFDFGTGDVDLTIRYDDALAASLGLSEGDLKFYHFVGGNWVDVTTGVDTAGNLISADGVDSFSLFAVGNVPEPTTMGLLAVGAVAALAQRRTR